MVRPFLRQCSFQSVTKCDACKRASLFPASDDSWETHITHHSGIFVSSPSCRRVSCRFYDEVNSDIAQYVSVRSASWTVNLRVGLEESPVATHGTRIRPIVFYSQTGCTTTGPLVPLRPFLYRPVSCRGRSLHEESVMLSLIIEALERNRGLHSPSLAEKDRWKLVNFPGEAFNALC